MPAVSEMLHAAGLAWLPFALSASLALYAFGLRSRARLSKRRGSLRARTLLSPWSSMAFLAGWLALVIALLGPIDEGAEVLLWVHMTQHELLMLVAAPLLVLGRPLVVWLWALPLAWRRRTVSAARVSGATRAWSVATTPLVAWGLHAAALWLWHAPAPYQAAVEHEGLHVIEHACFFGSALIFWWSLVHGRQGRLGYGAAVAYVFTTAIHSSVLGALLTFAPHPWYPIYASRDVARDWAPLVDQQMAGLLMWVPAGAIFIVLGLGLFAAWLGEAERRVALGRADTLARASAAERQA